MHATALWLVCWVRPSAGGCLHISPCVVGKLSGTGRVAVGSVLCVVLCKPRRLRLIIDGFRCFGASIAQSVRVSLANRLGSETLFPEGASMVVLGSATHKHWTM